MTHGKRLVVIVAVLFAAVGLWLASRTASEPGVREIEANARPAADDRAQVPDRRADPSPSTRDTVEADLAPRELRGVVVGTSGEPLFARVAAGERRALTARFSGEFTLACDEVCTALEIEAAGYVPRTVEIGLRRGAVGSIVMEPLVTTRVRVTTNGATVPEATVLCWPQSWVDGIDRGTREAGFRCLQTTTNVDGAAVLPGRESSVVYATHRGAASRIAIVQAGAECVLDLAPAVHIRVLGEDEAKGKHLFTQLDGSSRSLFLPMLRGVSVHALPLGSTPILYGDLDAARPLQMRGEPWRDDVRSRWVQDCECIGELPRRVAVVDAASGEQVPFVVFSDGPDLRTARQFAGAPSDGGHVVPAMLRGEVWVNAPGYTAIVLGQRDVVRLSRAATTTEVRVLGAEGWSDNLVIRRHGPWLAYSGRLRDGRLGPLDPAVLPAGVETEHRVPLGMTVHRDGEWIVDATSLGAIHVENWHELADASTGLLVSVWKQRVFSPPAGDGVIRFLEPGVYDVGYALAWGAGAHRFALTTATVASGKRTSVRLEKCGVLEGGVLLFPEACKADLVYYAVWTGDEVHEITGMETPATEDRYRWNLPKLPMLGVEIADRKRTSVVGILPAQGGTCRLRRVVIETDLAARDFVSVQWVVNDRIRGGGLDYPVPANGAIDLGWLPLEAASVSLRHGEEGQNVRIDASGHGRATFGTKRPR